MSLLLIRRTSTELKHDCCFMKEGLGRGLDQLLSLVLCSHTLTDLKQTYNMKLWVYYQGQCLCSHTFIVLHHLNASSPVFGSDAAGLCADFIVK